MLLMKLLLMLQGSNEREEELPTKVMFLTIK